MTALPDIMTTAQVADFLGVSRNTVTKYVNTGRLTALHPPKTGTATLFRRSDVCLAKVRIDEWRLTQNTVQAQEDDFRDGQPPRCYCGGDMVPSMRRNGKPDQWAYCSPECKAAETWEVCEEATRNGSNPFTGRV
ncbi:MAG: DNA-binding protein [Caulobacteraceae bacterium]|nr:DNA-binding protein [Caulobacteraceae bacterium]